MTHVVEYSASQKSFHISTMGDRMVNEAKCLLLGFNSDYKVIHECETYEEALEFYENKIMKHEI
jgi:hypothetical protein